MPGVEGSSPSLSTNFIDKTPLSPTRATSTLLFPLTCNTFGQASVARNVGGFAVSDESIAKRIEKLVNEEHHLYSQQGIDEPQRKRIREIEVELDICWDLLRATARQTRVRQE